VSEQTKKSDSAITSPISRRTVVKGAAALGAAAAISTPKIDKSYAAAHYLQSGPVEITYGTWFFEEPGRAEAWRAIIEKFHTEQSDIKIKEAGAAFNDYTNGVVTQLQANGSVEYDVIQTTPDLVLRLLNAGILTSLKPVLDANNITTLSAAHNYITVDGNVMGLDVVTVVFGLLYNKALLDGAGITALPTTTDDWLALSTELTSRPNSFGMFSPHLMSEAESFWFTLQEWACPFGGTWATGATPNLTTEPIMNAVQLFKNFYDATFPQGSDDATATRQWGENQIAQQLIVSAAVNVYKTSAPDLYPNIRSMSLPWASKQSIARIHPITVNAGGKNVDASLEWIKWLYKPENYRLLLTGQLDVIPSYDVGGLDEYFADLTWLEGYKDIVGTTPPEMVGGFIYNNQEFGQIVLNHVQEVLTNGTSVEDAMAAAQTEAEELSPGCPIC
jgi:ABC-type glycerol-3-phosphate transport system substrate-binding protein